MDFKDLRLPPSSSRAQIEKVALARKVGLFLTDDHSTDERHVVEQVARTLAQDISLEVRQTLAFELRRASELPNDLAERIARDVEEVAGPFLSQTEVFSDEDLAALVRELEEHARVAVARRPRVPSVVAVAIAESGGERSITFLIRNPGAELGQASEVILERFESNREMMNFLSERSDLSRDIVHRLIERVSDACRCALIERHGLDPELAADISEGATGGTLVKWVKNASRAALNEYVRQLDSRGAITDRLLNDVTRGGGVRLFESAMAFKTGIDVAHVVTLVQRGESAYLAKLLKKAGYSEERAKKLQASLAEGMKLADRD